MVSLSVSRDLPPCEAVAGRLGCIFPAPWGCPGCWRCPACHTGYRPAGSHAAWGYPAMASGAEEAGYSLDAGGCRNSRRLCVRAPC